MRRRGRERAGRAGAGNRRAAPGRRGRRLLAGAAVAAALLLAAGAAPADTVDDLLFELQLVPLDGRPAPAFTLPDLDGRPASLAAERGRVVLLYFWAAW